jgi:hypothetical protein
LIGTEILKKALSLDRGETNRRQVTAGEHGRTGTDDSVNDSEHELRAETREGDEPTPYYDGERVEEAQRGLDDLSPSASDRIRRFMAETTVRGGSSPGDVAGLYTSQEIVDDDDATTYLDRRFVHGVVPTDWRAFQDELSNAYLDGRPGVSADALLARVREHLGRRTAGRSIFDDPEDEDELYDEYDTTRIEGRDPNLYDLEPTTRRAIERYIVSEVLCYGVAPYRVMQLREEFRAAGDERALQYLDLPFELGDRPADWDGLRDRSLMVRARLESVGVDPSDAYAQADNAQPDLEADDLLRVIEERDRYR